ncbi:MAG: hypothetical protein RLN63_10595 [Miltoncostaeaceae bacterium]
MAAVRERLAGAGVSWKAPEGIIAARERIFVRDPVGNLVEFVQVLAAE